MTDQQKVARLFFTAFMTVVFIGATIFFYFVKDGPQLAITIGIGLAVAFGLVTIVILMATGNERPTPTAIYGILALGFFICILIGPMRTDQLLVEKAQKSSAIAQQQVPVKTGGRDWVYIITNGIGYADGSAPLPIDNLSTDDDDAWIALLACLAIIAVIVALASTFTIPFAWVASSCALLGIIWGCLIYDYLTSSTT